MTINFNSLESLLAAQAASFDSSTPTESIVALLNNMQKASIDKTIHFDADSDLPIDSDYDGMVVTSNNRLVVFNAYDLLWEAQEYVEALDVFQGTAYGYVSSGRHPALGWGDDIERFSMVSDGNSVAMTAKLLAPVYYGAGTSSKTHGYNMGGLPNQQLVIQKFPFAADENSTDVGDLTSNTSYSEDCAAPAQGHGYSCGGHDPSVPNKTAIEKFSFTSDGNATNIGDISPRTFGGSGQSSTTHGYVSGGSPPDKNVIEKFPFAADGNATDVGDLTVARGQGSGQSSSASGYMAGGTSNVIDKFSFTSDGNATDVGDLSVARTHCVGASSTTDGYSSNSWPANTIIDKFSFTSDGNGTNIGSLTIGTYGSVGHHV